MFPYLMKNQKFLHILTSQKPQAIAHVTGDAEHPQLRGEVQFYPAGAGTLLMAEVWGLPKEGSFFGFHIHEGGVCGPADGKPFGQAKGHWNPDGKPHPLHKGDLPVLLGNNGMAFSVTYTQRFTPEEAVGHTVILHGSPDDFTTQPSGNAGKMIGCGEIRSR